MIAKRPQKAARFAALALAVLAPSSPAGELLWERKSTKTGDLEVPNPGNQQTCCVVADFDGDAVADFAIGERTKTPSVVWYKWNSKGWTRHVIEPERLSPEAGGAAADLDGDGDPDLVLGQDASGNAIWWWENPRPDFGRAWKRRFVKNSGAPKHHDQTIGDFDGDDRLELVSWNQGAKELLWFEIPADPRRTEPWPRTAIYRWESGPELEGFPSLPVDVDGDGKWIPHELRKVQHGHTCEMRDIDGDGHLDILIGEMGVPGAGDAARTFLWLGMAEEASSRPSSRRGKASTRAKSRT